MKNITFNQVIPNPLSEQDLSCSDIWNGARTFEKGKSYLVEAASGSGKTTFLNIIFGLRNDYNGLVYFDENPLSQFDGTAWTEIRRKHISYLFQGLMIFPELTVWENLLLKNDQTNHKTHEEIIELLDKLQVLKLKDKQAGLLSFGQTQRIALIRAFCQPFDFLLLDEPFSHLDKQNIDIMLDLFFKETQTREAGLIITSLGVKEEKSHLFDHKLSL